MLRIKRVTSSIEDDESLQSHLCRVFKNVIGVSPAAWLRDHRKSDLGELGFLIVPETH